PHPTFLLTIFTPQSLTKPLAVLTATAKHRLLSADITTPLLLAPSNASLPATLSSLHQPSAAIPLDTFVQILEILDVGSSKWEQISTLESERKGETTKGREIIRVLPPAAGEHDRGSTAATQHIAPPPPPTGPSNPTLGPHKVLLQDMKGTKIWGFEFTRIIGLGGASIGCKMWLRKGCRVARGMVLLEPGSCGVVGGKIEGLDRGWREGKEGRLRA
ncbi:uncharacterized protein LY89DRAFT_563204, partial [Mollisia scopiformis]